MKKSLALFAAALCAVFSLYAQAPTIEWQKTIGGNSVDYLHAAQQTTDGGYVLVGFSQSNISGDKTANSLGGSDYWVVKLDADGAIQWQNTIGGNKEEQATSVQQTTDGGYIIGGFSDSYISGNKTEGCQGSTDYWVVKLDADGAIQWQNTIGGNDQDDLYAIQQTADGGYILGGFARSNISGDKTENRLGSYDYWIIKLDAAGNIEWQKTIGGNGPEYLFAVQQTADNGYIIGGFSNSDISGYKTENSLGGSDYWVIKLNATGNIEWQNTIGGNDKDELLAIQQTTDGGYILGGVSQSNISGDKTENNLGDLDYWIVKLDMLGNIQWQNTIGGSNEEYIESIQQTADGGYLLGGESTSNISGDKTKNSWGETDYWIVKLDATGNIQWQSTIGGNKYEFLGSACQTLDGGYILNGTSNSMLSGDKSEDSLGSDYWVLKLSPELVPTTNLLGSKALTIYPNPTTNALFIHTETPTQLSLYTAFGQFLRNQTVQDGDKIDLSTLSDGLYFLVEIETGVAHKIVKIK